MNAIFKPAIALMDHVRYPMKFAIIFLIVLIPLVILSLSLISSMREEVTFLESERMGLAYIKIVRQPIEHIQQHRGMTAAYLNGATEFRERIMQKRAIVDKKLAELKAVDDKLGADLGSGGVIGELMRQWDNIKANAMSMSTAEAIKVHSAMIADMLGLMSQAADASEITLDPKLDSYYMGYALVSALPNMLENMGQARAVGSSVAAKGAFPSTKTYLITHKIQPLPEPTLASKPNEYVASTLKKRPSEMIILSIMAEIFTIPDKCLLIEPRNQLILLATPQTSS